MLGVALDDEAPPEVVLDDSPAPEAPAGALRFFVWPLVVALLSLLEPALALGLVDSREAPPADAPVASELELLGVLDELLGAVDESLGAPADELLLGPALPADDGEFWAKAPVATPATAKVATAQSVVILRILGVLLRAPRRS